MKNNSTTKQPDETSLVIPARGRLTKRCNLFFISCESIMYMSPQCTKFSNEAINAIQQVNLNILLICNVCVSQNKLNVLIDRLKDKPENVQETKEYFKFVIKETMQNKIKETELTKTSNKEASENQSNENFKQVSVLTLNSIF